MSDYRGVIIVCKEAKKQKSPLSLKGKNGARGDR